MDMVVERRRPHLIDGMKSIIDGHCEKRLR